MTRTRALQERSAEMAQRGDITLKRAGRGVYRVELNGQTIGYVVRTHTLGWQAKRELDGQVFGATYRSPREAVGELMTIRGEAVNYRAMNGVLDGMRETLEEAQSLLFRGMKAKRGEVARKTPKAAFGLRKLKNVTRYQPTHKMRRAAGELPGDLFKRGDSYHTLDVVRQLAHVDSNNRPRRPGDLAREVQRIVASPKEALTAKLAALSYGKSQYGKAATAMEQNSTAAKAYLRSKEFQTLRKEEQERAKDAVRTFARKAELFGKVRDEFKGLGLKLVHDGLRLLRDGDWAKDEDVAKMLPELLRAANDGWFDLKIVQDVIAKVSVRVAKEKEAAQAAAPSPDAKGSEKRPRDAVEWLKSFILDIISERYKDYRRLKNLHPSAMEPDITVAYLVDELEQRSQSLRPDELQYLKRRQLSSRVRSAAESLRKQGKLGSSMGMGTTGREARCYEPADTAPAAPGAEKAGGKPWRKQQVTIEGNNGVDFTTEAYVKGGLAVHPTWGTAYRDGQRAAVAVKDMTAKERKLHFGASRNQSPGWQVTHLKTGALIQARETKAGMQSFADGLLMLAPNLGAATTVQAAAAALPKGRTFEDYRQRTLVRGEDGIEVAKDLLAKAEK